MAEIPYFPLLFRTVPHHLKFAPADPKIIKHGEDRHDQKDQCGKRLPEKQITDGGDHRDHRCDHPDDREQHLIRTICDLTGDLFDPVIHFGGFKILQ